MNNSKLRRNLIIFLFVFTTFFTLNIHIKAAKVGGFLPYAKYHNCSTSDDKKYCYDLCSFNSNGTCKSGSLESNRQLRQVGIYYVEEKTSTYEHAYCIEPGVSAAFPGSGYGSTFNATERKNNTINNISVIQQVLTFAPKLTSAQIANLKKQFTSVQSWKPSNFDKNLYYPVFASQGLIWEVLENQRTNFANCTSANCAPQHNSVPGGAVGKTFYTMIKNNSDLKIIYDNYVSIVQDVYYAYYRPLKDSAGYEFKLPSQANTYKLKWDSKLNKFALTIGYGSKALSYWKVDDDSTSNDLNVKMSDAVEITTDKVISKPGAQVQIKVNNPHANSTIGEAVAFKQSDDNNNLQDVIKVIGASKNLAIKVYTPNYQLKVIKEDEKGNRLKGVSFYVCDSNKYKKCDSTNSLKTITTNNEGEAIYDELGKPGTYYVKEVESPEGYVEDNTPYPVVVTEKNEAGLGVFAIVTIKNKQKEFTLNKTVWTEDGEVPLSSEDEWLTSKDADEKTYIGPEFVMLDSNKGLNFTSSEDGIYYYSGISDNVNDATKLRTNNGTLKVYGLPSCSYTVVEVNPPEGQTLPSNPKRSFNACSTNASVDFINGFTGLEFNKKNENGELLAGGEYTLQVKENNYYKDILLQETQPGIYTYSSSTKEDDDGATYIFKTGDGSDVKAGKAFIKNLPAGEYRVIEKTAPEGYELIEDKDSTAIVTISDANKDDNYIVEMVDRRVSAEGGEASAELVLTITTGRLVINYVLIIGGLVLLLVLAYILRKKFKK